jgi:hypothetical protein
MSQTLAFLTPDIRARRRVPFKRDNACRKETFRQKWDYACFLVFIFLVM